MEPPLAELDDLSLLIVILVRVPSWYHGDMDFVFFLRARWTKTASNKSRPMPSICQSIRVSHSIGLYWPRETKDW